MSDIKVVDLEGQWVINPHAFQFVDPESGARFVPGVPTKVAFGKDSWIAGQIAAEVLKKTPDPMKPGK